MNYNGVLQFQGTWRNYQARVLKNVDQYVRDGRIHIVAAPGSGKTTLGIELIRRFNENVLVLAPSITIREQWAARIIEAFLCEGVDPNTIISQNLKEPKAITIVTYQALHSAMTRKQGKLEETTDSDESDDEITNDAAGAQTEDVDFHDFDVVAAMKNHNLGLLCLDECHHLRSEWWKALEEFKKQCGDLKVIALTATPPYDSAPAMWKRYMDMCGEIDEEITIPELVKEGSLCPHQDFVYFNYPTEEEKAEVKKFEERSRQMVNTLMHDSEFIEAIKGHKALTGMVSDDALLDQPSYLAALLIFLQSNRIPFPARLQRLLGAKQLPAMDSSWMEKLLQGFLYDDADSYTCTEEYREQLQKQLKTEGLIEKRKVVLTSSAAVEKLLTNSKGKANSIRDIVFHEYQTTGNGLRLLLLTDYIRKEYEKAIGNPGNELNSLGVLPFFEMLRREAEARYTGTTATLPGASVTQASATASTQGLSGKLRLGVLCGTIIIIPAEAKEALEKEVEGIGKISFSSIGALGEDDYVKVNAVGNAHFLTAAVTNIFTQGYMQVLIGTKSLLGEGWDSPCINSLILASFVGSFMLSNQMRGRAIRVFKQQPDKTSNIWHLVCLKPWNEVQSDSSGEISEDFTLLSRRMEHFLGLHYTANTIENGMDRLSYIKPPYNEANVNTINQKMLELSGQRASLKERWNNAITVYKKMEIADETEVAETAVSATVFKDTLSKVVIIGILTAIVALSFISAKVNGKSLSGLWGVLTVIGIVLLLKKVPMLSTLGTPMKRLKAFGMGIRRALLEQGLLEGDRSKVIAKTTKPTVSTVYLSGGSGRDKSLFAQCVKEFFAEIDNQRYILVKKKNHRGLDGFYCVPECFAKKKEDAEKFVACMKPYIGEYDLVYTRNEKGRELLLEGCVRAMANREARCVSRKAVKSALE